MTTEFESLEYIEALVLVQVEMLVAKWLQSRGEGKESGA